MRHATLLLLLGLAAVLAPLAAGNDLQRYAALASRDARTFLWIADREAFLRRACRTPLVRVFDTPVVREAGAVLAELGEPLGLDVPFTLARALPAVLCRGAGPLALSFEGYALDQGRPRPYLLFLCDLRGYEGLLDALAAAGDDPGRLAGWGLPFTVQRHGIRTADHRGIRLVEVTLAEGGQLFLAQHDGVLFGASARDRLERALDRSRSRLYGSLRDSVRFAEVTAAVKPRPGAAFWYADLALMRRDPTWRRDGSTAAGAIGGAPWAAAEAVGVTLRGVGERFHARAFLKTPVAAPGSQPAENLRLRTPALAPADATGLLALQLDAAAAGHLLAAIGQEVGGQMEAAALQEALRDAVGAAELAQLPRLLGGEFALMQWREEAAPIPDYGFLLQARDPAGLEAWFDRLAPRPNSGMRAAEIDGRRVLVAWLPENLLLSRPAFAVVDGWLLGAVHVVALRRFLAKFGGQGDGLARAEPFLAPFDRLDRAPDEPRRAVCYLETPTLATAVGVWGRGAVDPLRRLSTEQRKRAGFQLMRLWDDPDFEDALAAVLVLVESRPDGVWAEAVFP